MDSSISIINSSVTELEKDNQNLFEKFTFESVITKLERPIGKGCPVYVMNASTGTIIHRTETDALSKVYIPNLRKYNKYLVIAADIQDIYNSVVFDVTWDFNKNLAYNYSLSYYDISNLDNIQAFFEYQEYEKATDQNVVVSLSHPYVKDTSGIEWPGTGTTYRDNVKGVQGFRFLNSNIYLPKSVFYQNLPFTFEAYFKLYGTSSTNQNILYQVNGSSGYFSIHIDPNLNLVFRRQSVISGISDITMTSLTSLKIDGNYHVALSYDGTSFYLFLNGMLQTTLNDLDGLPYVNTPLYVGHSYNGVISHPLITKTCKYTTNFDVLFKAFSYDPVVYNNPADSFANYVMLLIKNNDKTVQKMVDDKARNTRFENNVDENSTREFFNVSTHNPTINSYTNLPLGTKDFCIEVSAKVLSKLSATPMLASNIATNTQWVANNWAITFNSNANPNKFGLTAYNTTHWATIYPAILKEQFDLAVVREGTKLRFYINGFLDSENTIAANLNFDNRSSSFFSFGKDIYVNLYDLKFTLGSPRYTANYEPALIDIEDKVLLATQYQYVNLPFKKSLTDPNTPLTITNTSVSLSTLHSINGTSSALFDGTSSKISLASWYTGKEKFTVEMAVLSENLATIQTLFSLYSATVEFIKVGIKSNKLGYYNGTAWVDTSYVFTPNAFNHIVIKRDKTQLKILANGSLVATITLAADIGMNLTACIGASKGTADFFKGHLNNLYIYKNYIKYTDTYEVPVEEQVTDPTELEPVVVVNQYTTAALDFENGLIDKVSTTTWVKEGTANTSLTNKLYGTTSFETKNVGDSLYTTSKVITGGAKPFCIEFYGLLKADQSQASSHTYSIPLWLTVAGSNSSPIGFLVSSPYESSYPIPFTTRISYPLTAVSQASVYGNKIEKNTINKYSLSYDGAAFRLFVNDRLDAVAGVYSSFTINQSTVFSFGANKTTATPTVANCIFDNINIFDGEARVVRNFDEHADKLIIDLALDGENNNTKIVDNGILKSAWAAQGTAKLNTSQPFDGFSSLYLDGTNSYLTSVYNNYAIEDKDFTIKCSIILSSIKNTDNVILDAMTNTSAIGWQLYVDSAGNLVFYDRATTINGSKIVLKSTKVLSTNTIYVLTITRENNSFKMYIDGILENTNIGYINFGTSIPINIGAQVNSRNTSYDFNGYIKNFKIYKGVAVVPESPVGKIQLNFDNNFNDIYKNSTWTNTGVTFDQVNSIKGYSANFANKTQYLETSSNDMNFGTNNFSIEFDSKTTEISPNGEILTGNTTSDSTNTNRFFIFNNTLGRGIGLYNNNDSTYTPQVIPVYLGIWYNDRYLKIDNNVITIRNDVITDVRNLNFNLNLSNTSFRLGAPNSSFGTNSGFVGNLDNFKSVKDNFDFITKYENNVPSTTFTLVCNNELIITHTGSSVKNGTYVLKDSPVVKDYIVELNGYIPLPNIGYLLSFKSNTSDYSLMPNDDTLGYSFAIVANTVMIYKGQSGIQAIIVDSKPLSSKFRDGKYHIFKVIKNGNSIKLYIDNELIIDTVDSTYSNYASTFAFSYSNSPDSGHTQRSTNIKYFKVYDLNMNILYDNQFKSNVNTTIDRPAVHLPLETNSNNIGFTPLTINSVGNPTYTTIDNKKCIKFDSGKYLTINSNNIFNLGKSSDFYIEFDFYPIKSTNGLISNTSAWVSGTIYLIHHLDKIVLQSWKNNVVTNITTTNKVILNSWNNVKLYRKGSIVYVSLNDIVIASTFNVDVDFCFSGSNLSIGTYGTDSDLSGNASNAYMTNFKMFVGTSEIPETYHDKKVLSLDFKPTRKSYLFKDNNNKCVIHPVNITQRDYQDSQYCCTFNGTDQHLELGKNDLFNFGLDDFVIRVKFKWNGNKTFNQILCAGGTSIGRSYIALLGSSHVNLPNKIVITNSGGLDPIVSSVSSFTQNEIYEVTFVKDDVNLSVYINGVLDVVSQVGNTLYNFNLNLNTLVGRTGGNTVEHFTGTIYSVKILRNTTDLSLLSDEKTGEVIIDPRPPIDYTKRPYTVRFNFENNLNDAVSGSALTMSTGSAVYGTAVTKEVSSLASFDFGNSSTIRDMLVPSDLKSKFNLTGDFTLGFDLYLRSIPSSKNLLSSQTTGVLSTGISIYPDTQDNTKFFITLNISESSTVSYNAFFRHPLLTLNSNVNFKLIRKGNYLRAYVNNYFISEVEWTVATNFNRYNKPLFGNYTAGNSNNYSPDMLLDTFFICDNYVETFHAVEYTA